MRGHSEELVKALGDDFVAYLAEAESEGSDALSLDVYGQSSTKGEWTRQQKRIYQRVNSVLTYWEAHRYQVCWVMLSTAVGGQAEKLSYNHKRLRQKVEGKFGFRGMEHFQVQTAEGFGVLHVFWAWRARAGEKQRNFGIPQSWLSVEWERIHGASVVWIKRYGGRRRDRRNVSRYVVSQYCADQGAIVRCSWSWKRTFGFPMVAVWRQFRTLYVGPLRCAAVKAWEAVLKGETVMRGDGGCISAETLRVRYV